MTKQKIEIPADKLAAYGALIHAHPEIERKGKTMPYTSINGHMFSFMDKEGTMGLRLSKEDRKKFVAKFKTHPYVAHGSVLKEYVTVPESLLADTAELSKYLKSSFTYVKSLKPKPSRKKK